MAPNPLNDMVMFESLETLPSICGIEAVVEQSAAMTEIINI